MKFSRFSGHSLSLEIQFVCLSCATSLLCRNILYLTIASLNCQQLFGFLIKLFSPFSFGICTPQALLFVFTVLRQLYYNNKFYMVVSTVFSNFFKIILGSVQTPKQIKNYSY